MKKKIFELYRINIRPYFETLPHSMKNIEGHHFYIFFSHNSINYLPLFLLLLHLTRGSNQKLIGSLFERHLDAVIVDN